MVQTSAFTDKFGDWKIRPSSPNPWFPEEMKVSIEKANQGLVDDLTASHLLPMDKEAVQCAARCADDVSIVGKAKWGTCVGTCFAPSMAARKMLQVKLDAAQASVHGNTEKEKTRKVKYTAALDKCMAAFEKEQISNVPKMKAEMIAYYEQV